MTTITTLLLNASGTVEEANLDTRDLTMEIRSRVGPTYSFHPLDGVEAVLIVTTPTSNGESRNLTAERLLQEHSNLHVDIRGTALVVGQSDDGDPTSVPTNLKERFLGRNTPIPVVIIPPTGNITLVTFDNVGSMNRHLTDLRSCQLADNLQAFFTTNETQKQHNERATNILRRSGVDNQIMGTVFIVDQKAVTCSNEIREAA